MDNSADRDTIIEASSATMNEEETPSTQNVNSSKPEPASIPAEKDEELSSNYGPGSPVLVKIQGYPWWPAVVVTPDHFPSKALAARPQSKIRKDGSSAVVFPVQFLGAPEYYWSKATDMKPMSKTTAKEWLNSGKMTSVKGLKAAYQQALEAPSLETLLEAKVKLESSAVDEDATEVGLVDDEDNETELDDEGRPIKKKKGKKNTRTPKKSSDTPAKRRKTDSAANGDSAAKKLKTSAKKTTERTTASPELSPEESRKRAWDNKYKTVMYLRHKLQKTLLSRDEPKGAELEELPSHLEKLDGIDVDAAILRETKIGKVLVRVNKLDNIPNDDKLGIKAYVTKLLTKWQDLMAEVSKKSSDGAETQTNGGTEQQTGDIGDTSKVLAEDVPKEDVKSDDAVEPTKQGLVDSN